VTASFSPATLIAVAAGGATGSVLRYAVSLWMLRAGNGFPLGTLAVNVIGSFLIGVLARVFLSVDQDYVLRLALTTGFCGGFTTFSTFSAETLTLLQEGRAGRAAAYVVITLVLGVAATWLGLLVAKPRG
jgi:CrcB protein